MSKLNFDDTKNRIENIYKNHIRQDIEFQLNIVFSQLGDLARYVSHDNDLCPGVRPHGTKEDEANSYGHALAQLMVAAYIRGVDVEKQLDIAIKNMEDQDWKKVREQPGGDVVNGSAVCEGEIIGEAFVDYHGEKLHDLDDHILVIGHARPDLVINISKIKGIISDQGGRYSHAAIIAREFNIPCIVGTGSATKLIKHGQKIKLESNKNGKGTVHLKVEDE